MPDTHKVLRAPRMVGRDREYQAVQRVAAPGAARQPGAVAVVGPAGIGKSALVRAVARSAADVLTARAAPSTQGGLGPVVELAMGLMERGARRDEQALGVFGPAVAALLPGLGGSGQTDPLHAEVPHPVVLADGLLRLWGTLAVPRRPALVVEDLHWAGEATWAVTDRLLRRATTAGAGVVVTSRPEGPWWAELQHAIRAGELAGVELQALPAASVADLVADSLGIPVQDVPSQALAVVAAAGGLPLMVEEVLADLVRSGALTQTAGGWSWSATATVLPRPLADLTLERLKALPAGPAELMRRCAVLGVSPALRLLAATATSGMPEVVAAVAVARQAGLLEIDPATGSVEFRHELVREAVLTSMLASERAEQATLLLEALVGTPPGQEPDRIVAAAQQLSEPDLALAARLAGEAGLDETACRLSLALARSQLRRGLPLAAAAAAGVAAQPLPSADSSAIRTEALAVQVRALALAGEVDRALTAADLLDVVSPAERVWAREAVARALAFRGDWPHAEDELAPLRGPGESAAVTALAALIALERGRPEDAERWATRALQVAAVHRAAGPASGHEDADSEGGARSDPGGEVDSAAQCQALEVLGRLARNRDLDQAEARFRRCVLVAETAGLTVWRARALHETATIEQLRSLDVQALHEARQAAVEAGAPGLVGSVDFHLAAVYGVRFESSAALDFARGLLADARAQGAHRMLAWAWVLIAQAHAVGGHRAQADAAAQEAVSLAPGDPEIEAVAIGTGLALPALLAEDLEVALQRWREAITLLRGLPMLTPLPPWYLWPVLATVHDLDEDAGATARAEAADPQLRLLPGVEAVRLLAEAVAAGRAGDRRGATDSASAAARHFGQVPAFAGWRHLAYRWAATDAIGAGWGDPAAWMTEATDWFTRNGFPGPAAACRRLARDAGAPQRRRGRGDSAVPEDLHRIGVTSREMDVLTLVAQGLTNNQIATRLHLSPRTVKGYVEQLLAKTGTGNRTQLAARLTGDPKP